MTASRNLGAWLSLWSNPRAHARPEPPDVPPPQPPPASFAEAVAKMHGIDVPAPPAPPEPEPPPPSSPAAGGIRPRIPGRDPASGRYVKAE